MTSLAAIIQNHFEYDAWANSRLLNAAGQLTPEQLNRDFGTSDKSIKGTLVHIYRADRLWQARIEEGTPTIPWGLPDDEDWPALRSKWNSVQKKWTDWARSLPEDGPEVALRYTDMKGNPQSEPLWQIALHVVNHGTHHRGQISGFLRTSGFTPQPLDFIAFSRERAKERLSLVS